MTSTAPRIALVTHDFSRGGGTATVTRFLYRVLSRAGMQASVLSVATSSRDEASVRLLAPRTWSRGPACLTWQDDEVGPVVHCGAVAVEFEWQRYRPRPHLTALLNEFDLVQIIGGTPVWRGVADDVRVPVALFCATITEQDRAARLRTARLPQRLALQATSGIVRRQEQQALKTTDVIFAETPYTARLIEPDADRSRVVIAPPGIDTRLFFPERRGDGGYGLAVGRFSDPRKDVRLLLESYRDARRKDTTLEPLVVVGAQPAPRVMRAFESAGLLEGVTWRTDIGQRDLIQAFQGAGWFVLPSQEEGLGIVLLEAMACGVPVISTRCGGPDSVLEDRVTALLVPVGDRQALSAAMLDLHQSPSLKRDLGETGLRLVRDRFADDVAGRVYLTHYARLLRHEIRQETHLCA